MSLNAWLGRFANAGQTIGDAILRLAHISRIPSLESVKERGEGIQARVLEAHQEDRAPTGRDRSRL
jgi:hypothetical protein